MAQIPNGRLVKGQYKPIYRDCSMYLFKYCIFYVHSPHLNVETRKLTCFTRKSLLEKGESSEPNLHFGAGKPLIVPAGVHRSSTARTIDESYIPYLWDPCMEYLPTFTIKMNQM